MGSSGLQIDESESFQRKEARFERVGWAGMAALLVVALLGVLGGAGPVTSAQASAGPMSVDYPRFARYTARNDLTITLGAAGVREGRAVLTLESSWVNDVDIEHVTPDPEVWRVGRDGLRLVIAADAAPVVVHVTYRPDRIGPVDATVTAEATGSRVVFDQFVYP
ncbi:hypothetical protein [Streptomyces sp. TRM49041]|uniref:hypothetical protein n=1 Tax=Streptomyces sp. TRM49041 TaxID=2603216 RepID=UPI0011ECCBA9|nr:hypothetical protein [Streptomyces sp. TRM49041]